MIENIFALRILWSLLFLYSLYLLLKLRGFFSAQLNSIHSKLRTQGVVSSDYFFGLGGGYSISQLENFYKTESSFWALELTEIHTTSKFFPRQYHRKQLSFKERKYITDLLHLQDKLDDQTALEESDVIKLLQLLEFGFRRNNITFRQDINLKDLTISDNSGLKKFIFWKLDLSGSLSDLGINAPTNCFVAISDFINIDDCEVLKLKIEQISQMDRNVVLFVPKPISTYVESFIRDKIEKVLAHDIVVVTLDDLFKFIVARDGRQEVRRFIVEQIDLSKISPFTLTGPTSEQMFFGREQEIRLILENIGLKSYAIVGGRRIGKSSILVRLHKVMLPAADIHSSYIDFSTFSNYQEFLKRKIPPFNPALPDEFPATFGELLDSGYKSRDKKFVFLIDEADKIVLNDKSDDWKIFKALRSFANSGVVNIVLSGEQGLREAIRDSSSPLFNFTNEIILRPLGRQSVDELITRSMKQLEINLEESERLVDMIFNFTSGHPNIVQRLCHRLIEVINQKGIRTINSDTVNEVLSDPTFQRDDFLSTVWESATSLEKLLSLLMVETPTARTNQSLKNLLGSRTQVTASSKEIDEALQRLIDLRSILKRTQNGYEFSINAFPQVVAGTITLEDMLDVLSDEYKLEHAK